MNRWISAFAICALIGTVHANELCRRNSFTKAQAVQGRVDYESSCGLCHLNNLKGRVPGNFRNETPDIALLDANYLKTLDGNGGMTPPLVSATFLGKWKDEKTYIERISSAVGAFPPKNYVKIESDARIAAYIAYLNCGKL